MLGGVFIFLFQTAYWFMFMSSSLIMSLLCVVWNQDFILFACIFHTCGYAFYLSVSGNIQVDSIELLSTLATDG